MDIRKLTDRISVSPQIALSDIDAIHAAGFGTIICNRPDGESDDQTSAQELAVAAAASGIGFINIPITPGEFTAVQILAFADALNNADAPCLAYCRTGTRSTTLWALAAASGRSAAEIIKTAKSAGYDLSNIEQRLKERA